MGIVAVGANQFYVNKNVVISRGQPVTGPTFGSTDFAVSDGHSSAFPERMPGPRGLLRSGSGALAIRSIPRRAN